MKDKIEEMLRYEKVLKHDVFKVNNKDWTLYLTEGLNYTYKALAFVKGLLIDNFESKDYEVVLAYYNKKLVFVNDLSKRDNTGVHETHCCVIHGCKYNDSLCPVVAKDVVQTLLCEYCGYDGIETLEDLKIKLALKAEMEAFELELQRAEDEGLEKLEVSVELLRSLFEESDR